MINKEMKAADLASVTGGGWKTNLAIGGSPNSAYPQAGHLYDRYCDYFKIDNPYRKR